MKTVAKGFAIAAAALLAACGTDGEAELDAGGADAGGGAPVIQKLETNRTELTEGGAVSILATVTDPDGQADLVGGALRTKSGTLVGGFTAKSNGLFQLDLTWAAFAAVEPFKFFQKETRTFTVSFTDLGEHQATKELTLTFTCPGKGGGCGAVCTPLDVDAACGACGAACGHGQQCDGAPAKPVCIPRSIPVDKFGAAIAKALCAKIFECCITAEITKLAAGKFTDQTTCEERYGETYGGAMNTVAAAIAAGRATFDAVKAGTCITKLEDGGCVFVGSYPAGATSCEKYAFGSQPANAPCASGAECASGMTCLSSVCKAYLALGATCGQVGMAPCENSMYCNTTTHKCTKRAAAGEDCTWYEQCATFTCTNNKCAEDPPACDGK